MFVRCKMSKVEFRNPEIVRPPNSLYQIVSHPSDHQSRAIEVAVFNDHRYAFYFWNKWLREQIRRNHLSHPPALVSLDWHQDLCAPCETEQEWLQRLDLNNKGEVAFFTWAKLNPLNDGHILSAAYLNLIGNVYVHCRQGKFEGDWDDEELTDLYGNKHVIKKFKRFEALEEHLISSNETDVFFDLDLDFFTVKNGLSDGSFNFTYLPDKTIREMFSPERTFVKWLFDRMAGFTIAMEPEHTGGFLKANKYLALLDKIYFEPGLFTHRCNWRHVAQWRAQHQ